MRKPYIGPYAFYHGRPSGTLRLSSWHALNPIPGRGLAPHLGGVQRTLEAGARGEQRGGGCRNGPSLPGGVDLNVVRGDADILQCRRLSLAVTP
jgi:hypothetical protein